jgi:hypothetical protein
MKFLKIFLGIIIAIVIIFFVGGVFLPKTYTLSRSTIIRCPDSVVYKNVADFYNFSQWNPWYKMDPSVKILISGNPGQPGHSYAWNGKKTGEGEMVIKHVEPLKSVEQELRFIKPFEGSADNKFTFEQVPEGTKVMWTMVGQNKSTFDKWMGLSMDMMMGKDFENGLKDLKEVSEKKKSL